MPKVKTVTLFGENSPELMNCFEVLSKFKIKSDLLGQIVDRLLVLREVPQQIIHCDNNTNAACGADEIRVIFQPTDSFRELVATITRDFL